MESLKSLVWIGSSRADLKDLPEEVQDEMGYGLYQAQKGLFPEGAKPLRGLDGVIEIKSDFNRSTYRAVYVAKISNKIFVLHVFQKKSRLGIKTPKSEVDLIKRRLQAAHNLARGEK